MQIPKEIWFVKRFKSKGENQAAIQNILHLFTKNQNQKQVRKMENRILIVILMACLRYSNFIKKA